MTVLISELRRKFSSLTPNIQQPSKIFAIHLKEYSVRARDENLTTVLKAHREKLDPDLMIDAPLKSSTRRAALSISCCPLLSVAIVITTWSTSSSN